MPSKVLDYARSTYPEISDASDRDLSLYIAKRYPEMLGLDDQFAAEVEQYKNANTNFLSDFGDSFIKGVVSDLPVAAADALDETDLFRWLSSGWTYEFSSF